MWVVSEVSVHENILLRKFNLRKYTLQCTKYIITVCRNIINILCSVEISKPSETPSLDRTWTHTHSDHVIICTY